MKIEKTGRERLIDALGAFAFVFLFSVIPVWTGLGLIGWVTQLGHSTILSCLISGWALGAGIGLILGSIVGVGVGASD